MWFWDEGNTDGTYPGRPDQAGRAHDAAPTTPGYSGRKRDHLNRLTRVEGQVRGVARMVEEDRYCNDVLVQIAAATKALQQVALGLLDDHMRHCVSDAVRSSSADAEQKLTEVNRAVALALRL